MANWTSISESEYPVVSRNSITAECADAQCVGEVNCRERLGGLLRYRYRDAA